MSEEIKIKAKTKKTKLIIIIAAVVIVALTIGAIIFATTKSATAKKVEKQLSLGEKYLSELDYEQAIVAYELAIQIDPKSADAYLGLADVYIAMGDFEKAEEILVDAEDAIKDEDELRRIEKKQKTIKELQNEAEREEAKREPIVLENVADDFEIDWYDEKLELAMQEATGIKDRPITYGDVKDLTYLSLQDKEIADITSLAYVPNLESLWLSNNKIVDISPLSGMKNLRYLGIDQNEITDVSPLRGLDNLWSLYAGENEFTDYTPIGELVSLREISIGNFDGEDYSALCGLKNLNAFSVEWVKVTSFDELVDILDCYPNLSCLTLWATHIGDMSPLLKLKTFPQLQKLYIYDNNITNISFLEGHQIINNLCLSTNPIENPEVIATLPNVSCLMIDSCGIDDEELKSLADLTRMDYFNINNNQITDISCLKNMTEMDYLFIENNKIKDISVLRYFPKLTSLWMSGNPIEDYSPADFVENIYD